MKSEAVKNAEAALANLQVAQTADEELQPWLKRRARTLLIRSEKAMKKKGRAQ